MPVPITTYAQNFEDVMLWRALGHISQGFYVDIGAQDPVFDSVSRGFYEHGWRGLHVEPMRQYFDLLRQNRPDETVLQAAVSNSVGAIKFFEVADTGMSTIRADIAEGLRSQGWRVAETIVPLLTLDDIFEQVGSRDVHWLKIDVEGHEKEVLEGWRTTKSRPWVIVIEAIAPSTRDPSHRDWNSLVVEKGYTFVYFDGVNRYYVSNEHKELRKAFKFGPCVFDEMQVPENNRMARSLNQNHSAAMEQARQESERAGQRREQEDAAQKAKITELQSLLTQLETTSRSEIEAIDQRARQMDADLKEAHAARLIAASAHSHALESEAFAKRELDAARAERDQSRDVTISTLARLDKALGNLVDLAFENEHLRQQLYEESRRSLEARAQTEKVSFDARQRAEEQDLALAAAQAEAVRLKALADRARTELSRALQERDTTRMQLVTAHQASRKLASQQAVLLNVVEEAVSSVWWRFSAKFSRSVQALGDVPLHLSLMDATPSRKFGALRNLLAIGDKAFVEAAYRALLGREPETAGVSVHLERLRKGASRFDVVTEIRRSPEGRQANASIAGLDDALGKRGAVRALMRLLGREHRAPANGLPPQLVDLLAMGDEEFLRELYQALLGRLPDQAGSQVHMANLRAGATRLDIVASMRKSIEGQRCPTDVIDVDRIVQRRAQWKVPLVGSIIRWAERTAPGFPESTREVLGREEAIPDWLDDSESERRLGIVGSSQQTAEAPVISLPLGSVTVQLADSIARVAAHEVAYRELARSLTEVAPPRPDGVFPVNGTPIILSNEPSEIFVSRRTVPTVLAGHDWDESGYPVELVDNYNANFVGLGSCTSHDRKILVDSGVSAPVSVLGVGLDQWENLAASEYRVPGKRFRYLHASACDAASGVDVLLQSYGKVFGRGDMVSLVIVTDATGAANVEENLERLRKAKPDFPDVVVIGCSISDADLKAAYAHCHVFVAPCRAGGFGLAIARALISGLPVVTTAWGGHRDYCDSSTGWLVDFSFQYARTSRQLAASIWAEPVPLALEEALWSAYVCEHGDRRALARAGRERLLSEFSWRTFSDRLVNFVHTIANPVERTCTGKLGWVTTWNVKCGIATYAQHLVDAQPAAQNVIFAARQQPLLRAERQNCFRIWDPGKGANGLDQILIMLDASNVDALMIQFNYGFYNHAELSAFIERAIAMGKVVMVDLHSTMDPHGPRENFQLAELASALKKCHRIMAHGPADMNRLKQLGLVENVMLFPHGILNRPSAKPKWTRDIPTIASFGFAFANKGLIELVQAAAILKEQGRPINLQMVNAEYPAPESADTVRRLRSEVQRLGLEANVQLHTDFFDDDACFELLSEGDLIVNPYQTTGESASGAVRYGLAIGRPVAVTPLSIFDDLGDAVFRMPGTSPADLARGIAQTLDQLSAKSETARRVEASANRWRDEHDFNRQGARLMQIAKTLAS